jgi:hypothetical protein
LFGSRSILKILKIEKKGMGMNGLSTYCWAFIILIFGLIMIGSGVKVVIDKKVTYTRRVLLFKGLKIARTGRAAVVGGLSLIISGSLVIVWAFVEFSGKELLPYQGYTLLCFIWLVPVIGISIGEIIHKKALEATPSPCRRPR